jgi:hypothetical protein
MKILEQRFPKGTWKGQKTDGRYIDGIYYENLKELVNVIHQDMTFLAIISSSTLEVGTGKSVFAQQTGEAWIQLVNEIHKKNLPDMSMQNIVFKPKDLIDRAFKVPKTSVIILDEWEDAHYWSELGISLRQFFRKCRQLNLFIILIIPNFFQLPPSYAISRSVFFVDVRFEGSFERGYFSFYGFQKKKDLYIYGKKTQNYKCVSPQFTGRFGDGYAVDEKLYRETKMKDLTEAETKPQDVRGALINTLQKLNRAFPQITAAAIARALDIPIRTTQKWLCEKKIEVALDESRPSYNYNLIQSEDDMIENQEGGEETSTPEAGPPIV